jgi:hypothetical protein
VAGDGRELLGNVGTSVDVAAQRAALPNLLLKDLDTLFNGQHLRHQVWTLVGKRKRGVHVIKVGDDI